MLLVRLFSDPDLDFFTPSEHNIISNLFKYKSLTFQKCVSLAFQAIWMFLNGAEINTATVWSLESAGLQHGGAEGQGLQATGGFKSCGGVSGDTKRCLQ